LRLLVGSDHAGYALKEHLKKVLAAWGHQVDDAGCFSEEPKPCINTLEPLQKEVGYP